MTTKTIQGYAVVGPEFIGKSVEVKGIGQDRVEAWKDAAQANCPFQNLDAGEMSRRYENWKCVEADITVRFIRPEGM